MVNGERLRLRHHFERYIPDARSLAHPRDLRSKTRAPLVRLTSNFVGRQSTAVRGRPRDRREGVRGDGEWRNGGEGPWKRGGPRKREGPRCPAKGRGQPAGRGPRRPDGGTTGGEGPRPWKAGVRGREGSAPSERAPLQWKAGVRGREGGPRRRRGPRGSGKRGSVEERGSAPPGRRNSGEGAALFNAK
ncbi:hypothetical protein niasHT_005775 [Heterodera trifolii]|uniref:Uncharacterized protein n=1 Tax=Heterodera trifolii TaxID=157864 RepID=A0ABD2LTJ0_9BILA